MSCKLSWTVVPCEKSLELIGFGVNDAILICYVTVVKSLNGFVLFGLYFFILICLIWGLYGPKSFPDFDKYLYHGKDVLWGEICDCHLCLWVEDFWMLCSSLPSWKLWVSFKQWWNCRPMYWALKYILVEQDRRVVYGVLAGWLDPVGVDIHGRYVLWAGAWRHIAIP